MARCVVDPQLRSGDDVFQCLTLTLCGVTDKFCLLKWSSQKPQPQEGGYSGFSPSPSYHGLRASLAWHEEVSLNSQVAGGSGCLVAGWQDFLSSAGDFCLRECLADDVFATSLGMSPHVSVSGSRGCKSYPSSVLGRFSLWFSALSLIIQSSETTMHKYVYKYICILYAHLDCSHSKSK